jgi:hypothetical protein
MNLFSAASVLALAAILILCASGCQSVPQLATGQIQSPLLHYKITLPEGAKWRVEEPKRKNSLLITVPQTPGAMAVHVTPVKNPKGLVQIRASELLVNFSNTKMISSRPRVVTGQQAICQDWLAKLGKQDVEVHTCVFMAGDMIYDLAAWAPKGETGEIMDRFEELLRGFSIE